ncbi:MAG: hypothetical protein AAB481_01080 [Patescibacteria group bacterium]
MTDVTPAIFIDDFEILKSQIAALSPHIPWIQLDLSDGTMVPAVSLMDMEKLKAIIAIYPGTFFEAHLMVDNPAKYLKQLADSGFKRIIAQIECSDPRVFLDDAALESVEIGLALDGASEIDILEPFMEEIDTVVIMTIEAGSTESPFLPESVEKIKSLRHHFPDLAIVAEGNIDERNAKLLSDAGVTRLVISSDTLLKDSAGIVQKLEQLTRGV